MKKNSWFENGKIVKVNNKYVWCNEVKLPRSKAFEDDNGDLIFRTGNYSVLVGKNAYNQIVRIPLTPEIRKEAIEVSWEDFMWDSIN